jgi:hypothetical protein
MYTRHYALPGPGEIVLQALQGGSEHMSEYNNYVLLCHKSFKSEKNNVFLFQNDMFLVRNNIFLFVNDMFLFEIICFW